MYLYTYICTVIVTYQVCTYMYAYIKSFEIWSRFYVHLLHFIYGTAQRKHGEYLQPIFALHTRLPLTYHSHLLFTMLSPSQVLLGSTLQPL